jgi:hypothetical protein
VGRPQRGRPARPLGNRPDKPSYRRAKASGAGRIRAGGVERDVTLAEASADAHRGIDAGYHAKYDR